MRYLLMALAMVGLMAGPALAFQCPLLIKQINEMTGNRVDAGKNQAVAMAKEAENLHKAGKHAEAVAKADEAAKAAGIMLKKK